MSLQAIERGTIMAQRSVVGRPVVRAACLLARDSSTEVIDVHRLSQRNTSIIQYVEVADSKGHLYCVDGLVNAACWVKIVTLAKDCQSCNVLLMSTEKGVVLKVMRCIVPGEPLLMWFTENILALMNMPFLTPSNIQGQNRYTCHICNHHFEYPNPLKVHLALKCNRLDNNHLWSVLAREFATKTSPTRISPIIVERSDSNVSLANNSPTSSNQGSPTSSNHPSPTSSNGPSPNSSIPISPVRKNFAYRANSAFKPYENKPTVFPISTPPLNVVTSNNIRNETVHNNFINVPPPPTIRNDAHAAQMETLVSNLGKSKQGHLCIYCGKVYSRKYGLKIHIRTHTGYKPLKCKFCLRPFGDPSNLNKHVRLHADGETPYRCDLCGKVLVRRRDLERHIRSRHQDNADHGSDVSSDGIMD
ncbi:transcription factor hamlet [Venturia canescens]|uniref:transcription factor hamlet n=1 Tax=Venturia canescens TaxID=32260 RepID=UPI001C9C413C|nr:transcription factor hamlet [Venturia canescens]